MTANIYVEDINGKLVPAQFLTDNAGQSIIDTNTNNARSINIYNASGTLLKNANPNGYIVVPYMYSIDEASSFGQSLAQEPFNTQMGSMISAFERGGSQDVQRNYNDINGNAVVNGPAVLAFQDAASYALGVATANAGIPLAFAKIGGGLHNLFGGGKNKGGITTIFNNPLNVNSMNAGYSSVTNPPPAAPGSLNGTYADPVSGGTFGFNTDANGNTDVTYTAAPNSAYSDVTSGSATFNSSGVMTVGSVSYADPSLGQTYSTSYQSNASGGGELTETGAGGAITIDPNTTTGFQTTSTGVTLNLPGGSDLTVQASSAAINMEANATAVVDGSKDSISGSHDTIDIGSHYTGETIDGTGDTINLTKRGDDSVTIDGTGFDVTGDTVNNGVGLTGTDTSAIVHGGAYIGIFGNDETVTATGTASISVARRIHDLTIYASDADIYVGNYADATIWGQGDYIEHGTGAEISGSYYGTPGGKADSYGNDGSNYGGGGDGSDGGGGSYSSDDFARGAAALKKKPSPAHTSAATSAERAAATSAAVASGASNEGATASPEASSHTSTLTQSDMAEVRARRAAQGAPGAGGAATPKFEGPKWAVSSTKTGGTIAPVVTWSFATGPAGANDPFSGFLSASYKATIEKAFAAWAKASGVTFEEVSDTASSDIRIGWGDLETSSKGILGTTTLTKASGAITSAVIRLEDPSLAAVKTGAKGQEKYAGTGATLYQVALHEIGHALGLADNSDRNSVMFASSSKANRKLDATDIKGIQTLFGTHITQAQANPSSVASASATAGVNQLVQAMAAFDPPQAPTSLTSLVSASSAAPTLATPAHH